MNTKIRTPSNVAFQAYEGFIGTQNKKNFWNPWVLFEKSLSLYFDWPKYWIWRTLEQIMNIFCIWQFQNASKEVFWLFFFLNLCTGLKVPFCQFFHSAKMALLNPCMKIKKYFSQKTSFEAFWKCLISIHNLFQGPPSPVFRSVKSGTNWDFSQKGLTRFQKLFLFGVPMNP
jgi:hypothetical protein